MAHSKLILAVLQGEDYGDVVRQLNENGIFVRTPVTITIRYL